MLGHIRFFDYRCFRREAPATFPLARGVTSFIGPNNAGKSALIRAIYDLRNSINQLTNFRNDFNIQRTYGFGAAPPILDPAEIVCERDSPQCVIELLPYIGPNNDNNSLKRVRLEFDPTGATFKVRYFGSNDTEFGPWYQSDPINNFSGTRAVTASNNTYEFSKYFELLDVISRSMFVGPFRNAINEGAGNHFDTAIGTSFISQWHNWKTGPSKAQNNAVERVTEDIRRLMGADTLEISASNETKTLQVNVNKKPYKLHDLGSGISQMIVVLGNALIKKPTFIVIDEPELHLHPGLQSDFVSTLASYAEHGVIFATHSIGLARSISDNCYSVLRAKQGSIVRPFERTPNYAEFLGSMGIAGLQDIGWDRILLVEGPKDVRTFQQFLRCYGLDQHTIVMPLGGDSLAHGGASDQLAEIVRLGGKIAAVVDSERASAEEGPAKRRVEFANVCKELGIKCCVTDRRAIENYLTQESLNFAFQSRYQPLGAFDEPVKGSFWGKGESWRAARFMTKDELDATDIGQFIQSL